MRELKVELVAVGDELLVGDVVNTNAVTLGRRLTAAGLRVTGVSTVGDGLDEMIDVLTQAVRRADAVLVSGGLGPTSDDRTREAIAAVAGVALRRDPAIEDWLRRRYQGLNRTLTALGLQQADVPEGGRSLPNPNGSAPGVAIEIGDVQVYAVPGPPHEMIAMTEDRVLPDLLRRAGNPPIRAQRQLLTASVGEGVIAATLEPLEKELAVVGAVEVAYLATAGQTRVKLTSTAPGGADAVDAATARARELLGGCVYGEAGDTPAGVVLDLLRERGATVAVAESLTGGLVAAELTSVPGASASVRGSITAYATDVKAAVLGVDADLLAAVGAVHPDVAGAMAEGVRRLMSGTYGVATTGVAGPDPQDGKPVGTVHIAVAGPEGTTVLSLLFSGSRSRIREMTTVRVLDLLRCVVAGLPAEQDPSCTG
ncbi:CinA family nicotinamide mononucleotide deamidase-related protein [Embleya sp. NBC_00888]|uniref:CinA family nicotinamide mononucleotide deamidase-related protein n=1 Tax=Embleya sp. NBC_00888 TaxID=2975960 RepID=UPI00386DE3D8|nr:CinA family nicotinamide mononucleotide deamidase-related protein [Embleya sp. NBC_00888]